MKQPCVDPVAHAAWAISGWTPERPDPAQFFRIVTAALDLDGDNVEDTVVAGGASRQESLYHLYIRRGECGYYVGSIPSTETLRTIPIAAHGLRDIRSASDECPTSHKMAYCEAVWKFDGLKYQPRSEREIPRPLRGGVP